MTGVGYKGNYRIAGITYRARIKKQLKEGLDSVHGQDGKVVITYRARRLGPYRTKT